MSTEKLTIDSDGYQNHRRGHEHGPAALTSLVQLLTAGLSVVIIVLAIQQGTHVIIEEMSARKSAASDYQKMVADCEKEVAAIKVDVTLHSAQLKALEAKILHNGKTEGNINPQSEPGKTSSASVVDVPWQTGPAHQREKRAANSVTWPAGAGACVQGPPGRDGRDGMPGRDCPCGAKNEEINELRSKCLALEQRVSDLENNTDTTTLPCLGDTCNLPSSCTEVVERSGFNNHSFYVIDPDGPDRGVLPMVVQCDVQGGSAITLIGHNSEARTLVKGYEDPGRYSKDVTYWNTMDQVRAVVDNSTLCKQHIKYECHHSVIWNSSATPYAWWVTWNGRQADYWGGASPGSGKCACGQAVARA
ncbi:uncharacterized protein LOC118427180 [Branchiostoma floridae]|uniref:Uncharacterized protein LOC118427180 n=1 Tax=Branchiostoma floridae TaxID=7739 RepID=A0A9J7M0X9_BRAFL|nr:uncharacterized protein LOC118427180 [Branchiostoma floridae]